MAVTASKIEDSIEELLRNARGNLYRAILNDDNKLLQESIAQTQKLGGDLNQHWARPTDKCDNKKTPIILSIYQYNYEAMRSLLNTGKINLNLEDERGTPLMVNACRTGDENVVAMILRYGGLVNVQSAYKVHPLHAACFSSIASTYSIIFHSDWSSPAVKQSLISWWKGGEFTPTTPLRARWPGAIPLVALLLENGANPAITESSGLSPLNAVRDLTCTIKDIEVFELPGFVTFIRNKDQILTFQINLRDRKTGRKRLEVTVDVDFNMELPRDRDVELNAEVIRVLSTTKTRTMRGLIEAYAPKNKSSHSDGELLEIKRKVERIEISTLQSESDVKVIKEGFIQLCDEHVVMYEKFQEQEAYQKRLTAVKEPKGNPVSTFFYTVAGELDRLLLTYKLLMKDPKKFDKAEAASSAIGALANFAPAPFNAPGHAIAVLVKVYGQYMLRQEQTRVTDLLERDHGPMCDDLALRLSEHYGKQLADMEPEKAKKLAQNAVGVMFALMCDSEKTLNPLDSSRAIQDQLFEAVKTSDFFSRKLKEHLAPSKPRFILPSFSSKPTLPPAPPRSASQPPGPRTVKKPEDPKTSKSSSILSAFTRSNFTRSKSPEPPAPVASQPRCKPPAPSPSMRPTKIVGS